MAKPSYLRRKRDGAIEYLTLNRPEVRNAFNEELIAEISSWAHEIAQDAGVCAVVLSGAGPAFCAGADLAWMSKMVGYSLEDNVRDASAAAKMFSLLDALPVPVIARVQGAALGGGVGLAAVCDVVVAEEGATFGFTEVKVGLIPAIIAPYVLAKIGPSNARELFLTGRRFSAAHAKDVGLVHAVVAADRLDATVDDYLTEINSGGREAVAAAKTLLRRIARLYPDEATLLTTREIAERRVSAEAQSLMAKFLRKEK